MYTWFSRNSKPSVPRPAYPLLRNFRKLLFLFLSLYTIVVTIFSYLTYLGQIKEDVFRSYRDDIVLADNATESFFSEVSRLSAHLAANESALTTAMFQAVPNPVNNYDAVRRLQNIQLSYSYLDYIALYSQSNDKLLTTVDMANRSKEELVERAQALHTSGPSGCFDFTFSSSEKNEYTTKKKTLTFIAYSDLSKPGKIGSVFLGVNADYLQQLTAQFNSSANSPYFFIDHRSGVLSGSNTDLPSDSQIQKILLELDKQKEAGSTFVMQIDGVDTLVVAAENAPLSYTLLQLIPYDEIVFFNFAQIVRLIVVTSIIFCIGLFISFLVAYKLLAPLYALLNKRSYAAAQKKEALSEFTFLENELVRLSEDVEKSDQLLYSSTLLDLLLNRPLNHHVTGEKIAKLFHAPFYQVILLSVDTCVLQDHTSKAYSILQRAICTIVAHGLSPLCARADTFILNSTDIACVLALQNGQPPESLRDALEEILDHLKSRDHVPVSFAVGSVNSGIYDLNNGYNEVLTLMHANYSLQRSILFASDDYPAQAYLPFPATARDRLLAALFHSDAAAVRQALDDFFAAVAPANYIYVISYLSQLATDLFGSCQKKLPAGNLNSFQTLLSQLNASRSLSHAKQLIWAVCEEILFYTSETRPRYSPLISQAVEITKQHYLEDDFNVNVLSDILHITSPYFNRSFKHEIGVSYSDYLNAVRLDYAKKRLAETNLSVAEISKQSGFSNHPYFFTLFKKKYGVTPAEFRANLPHVE